MIQAAHFDIKTVTGLRQALVLSAEYENEPFPLQEYTLHGSIGTYPRQDLKCSVDENGRARIEWDSVPPGNWKYDVFLISASNDETPLMEGTFTALPRITPVLDDESVNDEVGGVLHLPSGNEGTITLEVDGGFVSKEYAAIAKDAADRAEQALKDIKQALQGVVTSLGGESGDILLDSGLKITRNAKENSVSLSLDDKTVVLTAGSQTIDGVKTFSAAPVIAAAPVADNEAANKKYVDDVAGNATDTTINGVSGAITLNLPLNMDADSKVLSVDLSNYASLQTDNTFTGSNTFFAGINGYVDSVNSTGILYTTNAPSDSSTGFPVLSIAHVGSSNVQVSAGGHLMLKSRGGNIYAQSIFIADNNIQVRGSALFNSGVTLSQSLTVGGPAQFNDIVRVETGKIDPGKFGSTWTFGSLIETPTTADNNNHRLACKTTNDNAGYILYHERVINGVWKKDKIILACQFDFTWHNDASILVKTPTEAKQAANKDYVDSQFNCLPLSYVTLDTDQTIKGLKNFTGNITVNSSGNNGTLTLYTSGGTGYLSMDTGEMVIPTDYLTITGQTNIQTLNVQGASIFIGGVTMNQPINANGGINIPLAVGAPTSESGVNRLYAAGLAAVTEAFSPQSFLSNFNLFGGSVAVDQTVPGWCWKLRKTSADPGTIQVNLMNPFLGTGNYSGWHGFVLPVALGNYGSPSARKLTFSLGTPGNVVKKTAAEMDMFTLSPAPGSDNFFVRFIDVTFYMEKDVSMKPVGYPVRVRELVYDSTQAKWLCYETLSAFPSANTTPASNMFLSYQQDRHGRDVRAGLWIGSNAADSRRLLCIADMHGVVDPYAWYGVGVLYWDSDGPSTHSFLGAMRQMTAPGYSQPNGAYAAFQALETRLIQSTTVTEFTPYE